MTIPKNPIGHFKNPDSYFNQNRQYFCIKQEKTCSRLHFIPKNPIDHSKKPDKKGITHSAEGPRFCGGMNAGPLQGLQSVADSCRRGTTIPKNPIVDCKKVKKNIVHVLFLLKNHLKGIRLSESSE